MSADVAHGATPERHERQQRDRRGVLIGFGAVFVLLATLVAIGWLVTPQDESAAAPVTAMATTTNTTTTERVPQPIADWGKDWAEDIDRRGRYSFSPVPLTRPPDPTTTIARDEQLRNANLLLTGNPDSCVAQFTDDTEPVEQVDGYRWELCVIGGYAYADGAVGTRQAIGPDYAQSLIDETWNLFEADFADDPAPTFTTDLSLIPECETLAGCAAVAQVDGSRWIALQAFDGLVN